jgi:hypothetical protein
MPNSISTCPNSVSNFVAAISTVLTLLAGTSASVGACLTVNLDSAPACATAPSVHLTGSVNSCAAVSKVAWVAGNNNIEHTICLDCGVNPSFAFDLPVGGPCQDYSVTVTATDVDSQTASAALNLPADHLAPVIHAPTNVLVTCASPNGAIATYTVYATDNCDPSPNLTCTPPSGTFLPLGITQVQCSSTDQCGNSNSLSFTVTVITNCFPNCLDLPCPAGLTGYACGSNCASVPFSIAATNYCNPADLTVITDFPPGYCFQLGTTWVHVIAYGSGQTAQCSFAVTILSNCPSSQTPPTLIASQLSAPFLQLDWTDPETNYVLQATTDLDTPVHWQEVNLPVTRSGASARVVVPNTSQGTKFFRLRVASLPIYTVSGPPVTASQFNTLASLTKLPPDARDTNGFVLFTDTNLFVKIPTDVVGYVTTNNEENTQVLLERLSFGQINQMPVLSDSNALQMALTIWSNAALLPGAPYQGNPEVVNSNFRAVDTNGTTVCDVPIDTKVRFNLALGGIPIIGPGAKAAITFDGLGHVTHLNYSLRPLQTGPNLPLLSQSAADQIAMDTYLASFAKEPGEVIFTSELVYYAPPAENNAVQTLIPHYQYSGSFAPAGTNSSPPILLRSVLIPAIISPGLIPAVTLSVSNSAGFVSGQATVTGGLSPYTYLWNSSSAILVASNSPSVSYQSRTRTVERLSLLVVDANGFTASASADAPANFQPGMSIPQSAVAGSNDRKIVGINDVGTEWIGSSAGLSGSSANAGGFVRRFSAAAGTVVRFNFGDFDAYERDFKDPAFGGDDNVWVDNLDAVFYTGHANGSGWQFTSSVDDRFLDFTEAAYGQTDLEWLVIAACGPLQHGVYPDDWTFRWPRVFRGLHLLCGYDNTSRDNSDEGRKWADYMLRGYTVAQAWIRTGIEVQSGARLHVAVMGVADETGACNVNDHYWGTGSVGPDVVRIVYSWGYSVPVD